MFSRPLGPQVSIHAPVKGATFRWWWCWTTWRCFNPRAREGRDRAWHLQAACRTGFNPRAREGRDGRNRLPARCRARFNPRAREGRDALLARISTTARVSIHAPVKGATSVAVGAQRHAGVSIHAPVKGATRRQRSCRPHHAVSIHAPVKGATPPFPLSGPMSAVSIHAPVKGATRGPAPAGTPCWRFNPRAREGRDLRAEPAAVRADVSIHAPVKGATSWRYSSPSVA